MRLLLSLFLLSLVPAAAAQIEMTAASGDNVGIGVSPDANTKLWVSNTTSSTNVAYGVRAAATGGVTCPRFLYQRL